MRADERLRDVVDAELERELEVRQVLLGERRDRQRDAGNVHALVRLDQPAGDDAAQRSAPFHPLDAESNVPVVDEHLVVGLEHRPQDVGRNRNVVRTAPVLAGDDHGVADLEIDGCGEVADPDLGPLQVGDQRERPPTSACTARTRWALSW